MKKKHQNDKITTKNSTTQHNENSKDRNTKHITEASIRMMLGRNFIEFTKPAENTLQDKMQMQLTGTSNIDEVETLREIPLEYSQQSGLLVPIYTPLTIM